MENEKQILDYLFDKLSKSEISDVENRLSTDPEFVKEFVLLRSMHIYALKEVNKEKWQPVLKELAIKYFDAKQSTITPRKYNGKVLIIIALLIGLGYIAFYLSRKTQDLYEKHIDHFALHLTLKSSDVSQKEALQAENSFNNKEYSKAYISLKKYLLINPSDTKAKLALGICALELGNDTEAVSIFDEIRSGNSTLKDYATWNKAMFEVKNEEYLDAILRLSEISNFDPQLREKANKLLEDLNKKLD